MKIFADHIANKGLVSKIHKELSDSAVKTKSPIRKRPKAMGEHFNKLDI